MKSKLILLLAIILFVGLVLLLSRIIEKNKTSPKVKDPKKSTSLSTGENEEEISTSGAMESMQWISQVRAYPETDIPADKFYKAFEYSKERLQDINDRSGLNPWKSIGPDNIGGRSLCVAVHPVDTNIIFIGSSSGGLWKSTTGGTGASAWTLINTGFPSSAVSSIAIDSSNPNIMYIGTGENYGYQFSENGLDVRVTRGMYGIGILKTTDGGNTWTKSLDWAYENKTGVWNVLINPKNSNVLYAATSEGIYKSVNAGSNWTPVLNYKMVMDLEINPVDTNILYASIGNLTNNVPLTEKGIYKTTNSGSTWTKLAGGLPAAWSGKATLELYKRNPNLVYASIPNDFSYVGYYKSSNAGANWVSVSSSIPIGNQGWYNNGHLVKSNDSNAILVGTINVEKSTNGGTTFLTKSDWGAWVEGSTPPGSPEGPPNFVHADVHFYTSNPKDPNKIYVTADGGLYRSNNFGETFYSCNGGFVTSQFYATFANSVQDSGFSLGGLQDNRSALYNGSNAWYKTFFGDGMSCAINSQDDQICYTEYTYGGMYRSNNRGIDWNSISPPGSGSESNYCFNTPFISCNSSPNVLFVGGKSIYKSTNNGDSWLGPYGTAIIGGTKILSITSSYTSTDTVYCGAINGRIFRTIDGGSNWIDITDKSIIPDRYATDITVNPNHSNELLATFGGFGSGHVFRSSNAGINWIDISGNLPDLPHHSVVIDPVYNSNVYVGNDLGVYVTTNGGSNWYEYRSGMPYALVFDLTVVYPNRKLRVATYGNGIFERDLLENPVSVTPVGNEVVKSYSLSQNYPNPFNPVTKIKFAVPSSDEVKLNIYDALGKKVRALVDQNLAPGNYEVEFNGYGLAGGTYFFRIETKGFTDSKKMILLK
ncbi:MAG: T9SS type A sorting domain-containing protein [Ignavibacteria bacterium]